MSYNAADITQVRERRQREKDSSKAQDADFRWLLEQPQGRRFIWRMLSECRVFQSSFHPSSQIYFNEGIRSVGLNLMSEISRLAPEALLKMFSENRGQASDESV